MQALVIHQTTRRKEKHRKGKAKLETEFSQSQVRSQARLLPKFDSFPDEYSQLEPYVTQYAIISQRWMMNESIHQTSTADISLPISAHGVVRNICNHHSLELNWPWGQLDCLPGSLYQAVKLFVSEIHESKLIFFTERKLAESKCFLALADLFSIVFL